jgi:hypothetical protein
LGTNDGSQRVPAPDGKTLLGSIPTFQYRNAVGDFTFDYYDNPGLKELKFLPFFLPSAEGVNKYLYDSITKVETSSFKLIKSGRLGLDSLPDGSITFKNLSTTNLKAILAANDIRDLELHRNNGVTALVQTKRLLDGNGYVNGTR